MMTNVERAEDIGPSVTAFAERMGLDGEDPEAVAADMICNILHWAMRSTRSGADPRAIAIDAARCGIAHFITETNIDYSEFFVDEVGPECLTAVEARCNGETWRSATGVPTTIERTM
ncbi:MAG: hypothetical protein JJ902_05325 [Roseibium sp.]|nr:hypothetical protein [Roseibium sp.]